MSEELSPLERSEEPGAHMSENLEIMQRSSKGELLIQSALPTVRQQGAPHPAFASERADGEIAKLVQRLFVYPGNSSGPRVVSFSGMTRDDRSSWICARAGMALATQTNDSVCVVDANFWSPQLHAHFSAGNLNGLTDALTTKGSIRTFATSMPIGDLWLMPSGSVKRNLYRQVDRYLALFAELREEFTYILISAPPLTRETEATLMGQLADGIVLIVEANQTKRETVRRAKEQLENAQVQVLGSVLDQRTLPIPDFLYWKL